MTLIEQELQQTRLPKYLMDNKIILLDWISSGSFGSVFKGTYNGDDVAVKRQLYGDVSKNEYQMLTAVKSENVVKAILTVVLGPYNYIVMEQCQMDLISYVNKFSKEIARPSTFGCVARQLINGLQAIHKLNIVHRDLKPANIVVIDNIFKICDFGISVDATTHPAIVKGTLKTMAPEVLLKEEYGLAVDVWSLGIVFYFMCTQAFPFNNCKSNASFLASIAKRLVLGAAEKKILQRLAEEEVTVGKLVTYPTIFLKHSVYYRHQKLILKCLHCDGGTRPTAEELLDDIIFKTLHPQAKETVPFAVVTGPGTKSFNS